MYCNTIILSRHEQVCFRGLRFVRYFSHHRADDGRGIFRNVAHLNILVPDVINLLYYEYWADRQKYFYEMYCPNSAIKFKTLRMRSNLCDYNSAYIHFKRTITVLNTAATAVNNSDKKVILKIVQLHKFNK